MTDNTSYVYLGLGSNLGDRHTMLLSAIEMLVQRVGRLVRCSSFIETEPVGFVSANSFLNAVVLFATELSPRQVLEQTKEIETELGRTSKSHNGQYSDRCIDIDILRFNDISVDEPDLQIPHPRILERDFVLRPMKEIQDSLGVVATIGFFDGVHCGHQNLVKAVVAEARKRGMQAHVITFDCHPRALFAPESCPPQLSTHEEKAALLRSLGVDKVDVLQFDKQMSELSAHDFMRCVLLDRLGVHVLVVGYDHHFGHPQTMPDRQREGLREYMSYGKALGIEVIQGHEFSLSEAPHISSSTIRHALAEGHVEDACILLGRPYTWKGRVIHGHAVGRKLGFPTANLTPVFPKKMLPGIGAYAVWAEFDRQRLPAMVNIGRRPTMDNGTDISIEVNLIDFEGDLYGTEITLVFVHRLRTEKAFANEAELTSQLQTDRKETLRKLGIDN